MAVKPLAIYVGAAAVTLAALLGVSYERWSQRPEPGPVAGPHEVKIVPPPVVQPSEAPQQTEEQKQAAVEATDATKEAAGLAEAPKPEEEALAFDIVRVEGDGAAVIAGRARGGAEIVVKLDGEVIGRARANERGEWVVVPENLIAKGDHQLTLEAQEGERVVVSEQAVIVKVPENADDKPLIVLAEPMKPSRVLQAPEEKKPEEVAVAEQKQPTAEEAAKAAAELAEKQKVEAEAKAAAELAEKQKIEAEAKVAAELAEKQKVEAEAKAAAELATKQKAEEEAKAAAELAAKQKAEEEAKQAAELAAKQKAEEEAKAAAELAEKQKAEEAAKLAARQPLSLDSVDYNDRGDMMFAGRATSGAVIRLYVDNSFIADTMADATGSWTFLGKEQISVGTHQLRADEIDATGKVIARVEVPFARADAEAVALLQKSRELEATAEEGEAEQPAEKQPEQAAETAEQPAKGTAEVAAQQQAEQAAETADKQKAEEEAKAAAALAEKQKAEEAAKAAAELAETQEAEQAAKEAAELAETQEAEQAAKEAAEQAAKQKAEEEAKAAAALAEKQTAEEAARQAAEAAAKEEAERAAKAAAELAAKQKAEEAAKQAAELAAKQQPEQAGEIVVTSRSTEEAQKTEEPAPEKPVAEEKASEETKVATQEVVPPQKPKVGRVVIQPGNNLWNISRVIYGRGIQYTVIYQANRDYIRDPDLIYPGQIFATPGVVPPQSINPRRRKPLAESEKDGANSTIQ